ncbi:MAG: hypothetical protein AAGJ28_11915 [Pseudomonadota bacterium]
MIDNELIAQPESVVLEQDACLQEGRIDYARWTKTVFLPLSLVGDGKVFVVEDAAAFTEHLKALEVRSQEIGVFSLRTTIGKVTRSNSGIVLIRSVRARLAKDGAEIGKSSITWTLIMDGDRWKISQISFDDALLDPSVTSQVFLGRQNKGRR